MKKVFSIILISFVLVFSSVSFTFASNSSAYIGSSSSVQVGNTITVTVSISGTMLQAGKCSVTVDDGSILSYNGASSGTGTITKNFPTFLWETNDITIGDSNAVFYVEFYANKVGTTTVRLETSDFYDANGRTDAGSDYVTITVTDPPKSGNNNLDSITPSTGTLVPAFSPDVTNYSITVENSISEIVIGYTTSSGSASASISGSNTINVGNNERVITVTAANGSTKSYKINLIRAAENGDLPDGTNYYEIQRVNNLGIDIGGTKYLLLEDFTGYHVPQGFKQDVVEYNGFIIPILTANKTNASMAYALPYVDKKDEKTNATNSEKEKVVDGTETSNNNETQSTIESESKFKEFTGGVWVFYNKDTKSFIENYSISGDELVAYSHYLLFGDEEEPEPEPSLLDDALLIYVVLGTLAVLFIVIVCLQISILSNKNKDSKKVKKERKKKDKNKDKETVEIENKEETGESEETIDEKIEENKLDNVEEVNLDETKKIEGLNDN